MAQRLDQISGGSESATPAPADAVDEALAAALTRASAAAEWGIVAQLARELEVRRVARERAPAKVIALDDEKRRRGR